MPMTDDASPAAFELLGRPAEGGPFFFTCEHAGRALPEWQPTADDLRLLEDHWGWDIGAADLTRSLARLTGCPVFSRGSRGSSVTRTATPPSRASC